LEAVSFHGNPIEKKIVNLKHFVLNDIAKLKYFNWEPVTKEDRTLANKLESQGVWDDHLIPISKAPEQKQKEKPVEQEVKKPTEIEPKVPVTNVKSYSLDELLNDLQSPSDVSVTPEKKETTVYASFASLITPETRTVEEPDKTSRESLNELTDLLLEESEKILAEFDGILDDKKPPVEIKQTIEKKTINCRTKKTRTTSSTNYPC